MLKNYREKQKVKKKGPLPMNPRKTLKVNSIVLMMDHGLDQELHIPNHDTFDADATSGSGIKAENVSSENYNSHSNANEDDNGNKSNGSSTAGSKTSTSIPTYTLDSDLDDEGDLSEISVPDTGNPNQETSFRHEGHSGFATNNPTENLNFEYSEDEDDLRNGGTQPTKT
ncbi:unnamed protein product [[Candida] boidinii]|nr:unnamed protein product [[Candida] boidinii]